MRAWVYFVLLIAAVLADTSYLDWLQSHSTRMPSILHTAANMTTNEMFRMELTNCTKAILPCTLAPRIDAPNPDFRTTASSTEESGECWREVTYLGDSPSPTVVFELTGWCKN